MPDDTKCSLHCFNLRFVFGPNLDRAAQSIEKQAAAPIRDCSGASAIRSGISASDKIL